MPNNKLREGNELIVIKDTLHNNEYNINLSTRHPNQHKRNKTLIHNIRKRNGLLSHRAVKKQRNLQNSFKEAQIKVAVRTRNTIQNLVKSHSQIYR
jgi:hypothetical protein